MRVLEILYFVGFTLLYLGVPALIVYQIIMTRRTRAAIARGDGLAKIAPALGGEVTRDPSFDGPVVRFVTQGITAWCHQWMLFDSKPDIVTTFECRLGFQGFFQATSTRALRYPSRSPRFLALDPVASFQIVTTDYRWARELLDSGLREILRDFQGWRRRCRIQLAADRFLVEVESRLGPAAAVDVARLVMRVAALARASRLSAGVTFVGDVDLGGHARCPVCGQLFNVAGIRCGSCKVPHHADCWDYWGRCAIFGCRGRRIA